MNRKRSRFPIAALLMVIAVVLSLFAVPCMSFADDVVPTGLEVNEGVLKLDGQQGSFNFWMLEQRTSLFRHVSQLEDRNVENEKAIVDLQEQLRTLQTAVDSENKTAVYDRTGEPDAIKGVPVSFAKPGYVCEGGVCRPVQSAPTAACGSCSSGGPVRGAFGRLRGAAPVRRVAGGVLRGVGHLLRRASCGR